MKKELTMSNVAEVQLTYKTNVPVEDRVVIKSSKDAYDVLVSTWDEGTLDYYEEFKILLMNRGNAVLAYLPVSKGGINGTVTDNRIIFQAALKTCASGIILCHNHPSGKCEPSGADLKVTQRIKDAAELLDMTIFDHIIITSNQEYYSFADHGDI